MDKCYKTCIAFNNYSIYIDIDLSRKIIREIYISRKTGFYNTREEIRVIGRRIYVKIYNGEEKRYAKLLGDREIEKILRMSIDIENNIERLWNYLESIAMQ